MQCFSCSVPCEDQLDGECLIIFSSYYPQPGARSEGVVYPGEVLVNVELQSQLDSDSIACSVETDTSTSCTAIITRDVYTVTVNQTNDFGSTVNISNFDGMAIPSCYTLSRLDYLTAKLLIVTEEILSSDAESLRVTVSVNELCPSDKDYLVLVTFGTRPLAGGGDDCVGQVNTNVVIIVSSPHSLWQLTLLVWEMGRSIATLLSLMGKLVSILSTRVHDHAGIISSVTTDDDESVGLSTGAAVGISVALTLLVALPVGVVIGVCVSWCVWKSLYGQHYETKQKKLQGANAAAIYEDPEATGVRETAIPLSHNQAYGQVDLQGRRGN